MWFTYNIINVSAVNLAEFNKWIYFLNTKINLFFKIKKWTQTFDYRCNWLYTHRYNKHVRNKYLAIFLSLCENIPTVFWHGQHNCCQMQTFMFETQEHWPKNVFKYISNTASYHNN